MVDSDYWREEAARHRDLAQAAKAKDRRLSEEHLDLATVCEEVAEAIEQRLPSG